MPSFRTRVQFSTRYSQFSRKICREPNPSSRIVRSISYYLSGKSDPQQVSEPITFTAQDFDLNEFKQVAILGEYRGRQPVVIRDYYNPIQTSHWFPLDSKGSASVSQKVLRPLLKAVVPFEYRVPYYQTEKYNSRLPPKSGLEGFQKWLRKEADSIDFISLAPKVRSISRKVRVNEGKRDAQEVWFDAPLALLRAALEFNAARPAERVSGLFVRSFSSANLSSAISHDFPVPDLISRIDRGELDRASGLCIGIPNVYTMLHRENRANLICQLVGARRVRLLEPGMGGWLYNRITRRLGQGLPESRWGRELFNGPFAPHAHHSMWADPSWSRGMRSTVLRPGDALYIPPGWWNSTQTLGKDAHEKLDASVNWWHQPKEIGPWIRNSRSASDRALYDKIRKPRYPFKRLRLEP